MATEILQTCTDRYPDDAQLVLLRPVPELGNTTALQIAHSAASMTFVSSQAYQTMLVKLWYGQIDLESSTLSVIKKQKTTIFVLNILN